MNINKKTTISIVLALLMIASTLSVMPVNANELTTCGVPPNGDEPTQENLEVTKMVLDGSEWVDLINAEIDDTVSFKITVTYYNLTDPDNPHHAKNIVVKDILPSCLNYSAGSASPFEPALGAVENELIWNVPDVLYHEESYEITFNATVIECSENECGENINTAEAYAYEQCTGADLYAEDTATVIVECEPPCEPGIEVIKKVWNGTAWAEYLDELKLDDIVKFQITINYEDCGNGFQILNMIVEDILPCCLQYVEDSTIITSTASFMQNPNIEILNGLIYWKWVNTAALVFEGGQSLTIEFDTTVYQYCEGISENWAYVTAWGCEGPEGTSFTGQDNATVDCTPPVPEFEKTVLDGKEWVNEINTTVGDTLRFKLSIIYFGEEEFDGIKFKDILPCILEYADNAMAYAKKDGEVIASMEIEGDLQSDNKTVFFNISNYKNFTLYDGVEISVEFDAIVTGLTECGCECDIDAVNKAWVYLYICNSLKGEFYDEVLIRSRGNCPPYSTGLKGPSKGLAGEVLQYTTSVIDPDDDQVYFMVDWDDGTAKAWDGPYDSSEVVSVAHTFAAEGEYEIKVKAMDEHGLQSAWTSTIVVTITTEEEPEEGLGICVPKMFHLKNVAAQIKNLEEGTVSNIDWTFNITKTGIAFNWDIGSNGTIETLAGGAANTVSSGDVKSKFGRANIDIVATADGEDYTYTSSCFVLGRIVLVI